MLRNIGCLLLLGAVPIEAGLIGYVDFGGTFFYLDYPHNLSNTPGHPTASETGPNAINDLGAIVGFNYGLQSGFLFNGAAYTTIMDPNAQNGTFPSGINNGGVVVGNYTQNVGQLGLTFGFFYSAGIYTTLNYPGTSGATWARGINNSGAIVGSYLDSSGAEHGFLYSGGGNFTTIDEPNAYATFPNGINDNGEVVGAYSVGNFGNAGVYGFLYSTGNFTPITDPVGTPGQFVANGINNNGVIVGYEDVTPPAPPIPEPACGYLIVGGLVGI